MRRFLVLISAFLIATPSFAIAPQFWRVLVLRMYWDNEAQPSVEVPLGDFFCNGSICRRDCGLSSDDDLSDLLIALRKIGQFPMCRSPGI